MAATPWGAIAQGALGAGSMIAGGIMSHKAKKDIEQLQQNRPEYQGYDYQGYDYNAAYKGHQYQTPEEIQSSLGLYQQRAARQGLPGQSIIERQLQASTARGTGAARQAATTSAGLMGATQNLYGQEMQALEQLAIAGAREKAKREAEYAGAQMQAGRLGMQQQQLQAQEGWKGYQADARREQMEGTQQMQMQQLQAQDQLRQYQYNQLNPYQEQMANLQSQRQAGMNLMSGGIGAAFQGAQGYAQMRSEQQMNTEQMNTQESIAEMKYQNNSWQGIPYSR